jgi:hypothetical protein
MPVALSQNYLKELFPMHIFLRRKHASRKLVSLKISQYFSIKPFLVVPAILEIHPHISFLLTKL